MYPTGSLHRETLPPGQQFMIDLLVSSLMADRGLEDALVTSIAHEVRDPAAMMKPGMESSVPLLQLVRQLISNSTSRQMSLLKQVGGGWLVDN